MNNVELIGRIVKKPELAYTQNQTAVTHFAIAVDRPRRNGEDAGADFPNIVCFGKTAENVCMYMDKGRQVAVSGRLQTGSYKDRDGRTVYTTDVVANNVEFLDSAPKAEPRTEARRIDDYFETTNDDVPF